MALYKRPDSVNWWMKFSFEGRLIQQSTKTKNRRVAEQVEAGYRTGLALGKVGIKPKEKVPTFKDAVKDFLEQKKLQHTRKPITYLCYANTCKSLLKFFGATPVDQIGHGDVEKFLTWRSKQISKVSKLPVSTATVNYELTGLSIIFKTLVSKKVLTENPARNVKRLSPSVKTFYVLNDQEEKIYLLACSQPLQDIATLILETGMRPREIFALQRKDVTIKKSRNNEDGGESYSGSFLMVVNGKTSASNRKVYLNDKAANILQKRLEKFPGNNPFPFRERPDDKPIGTMNFQEAYKWLARYQKWLAGQHREALENLEIKFRLYDCRHTFATRTLESEIDLRTLADLLGHATLDEVMRYAHVSDSRKQFAIQKMQDLKTKKTETPIRRKSG